MKRENIPHTNPYTEEEGYVKQLVTHVTEEAIQHGETGHYRWHKHTVRIAASIAAVAVMGLSGWSYIRHRQTQASPLDTFLSSISDDEATQLEYYCIEEIDLQQ